MFGSFKSIDSTSTGLLPLRTNSHQLFYTLSIKISTGLTMLEQRCHNEGKSSEIEKQTESLTASICFSIVFVYVSVLSDKNSIHSFFGLCKKKLQEGLKRLLLLCILIVSLHTKCSSLLVLLWPQKVVLNLLSHDSTPISKD